MPLITNNNQLNHQVAIDFAKKIKLIDQFKASLSPLYREISHEYETLYKENGQVLHIHHYREKFQNVIESNYITIANAFKFNIREGEKAMNEKELAAMIDTQLSLYVKHHSINQTEFIISTLDEKLKQGIETVIIDAAAQGITPDRSKIASSAARKFRNDEIAHAGIIATTETNNMANEAKYVEATSYVKAMSENIRKMWKTVFDDVTRAAHIIADGQEVGVDEPFSVNNEFLMFPTDMSLGASLENIMNCRCDALFMKS